MSKIDNAFDPALESGESLLESRQAEDSADDGNDSAAESADDTQLEDNAQAEDNANNESGTSEESEDWKKHFKSPEEMYKALQDKDKSYNNLRPKFTQVTQELSKLRNEAMKGTKNTSSDNSNEGQRQQPAGQAQSTNPMELISSIVQEVVKDVVRPIAQKQEEMSMTEMMKNMADKYEDFLDVAPEVQKILSDEPDLWKTSNPIEIAYMVASRKNVAGTVGKMLKDAKNDAYADKELKNAGGVGAGKGKGSSGGSSTKAKTAEDHIREQIAGTSVIRSNRGIF